MRDYTNVSDFTLDRLSNINSVKMGEIEKKLREYRDQLRDLQLTIEELEDELEFRKEKEKVIKDEQTKRSSKRWGS